MTSQTIHVYNMGQFARKLAELNRKAAKLGYAEIVTVDRGERSYEDDITGDILFTYNVVEVISQPIVLAGGWRLVAKIDHKENLCKTVPGETFPPQYIDANPDCDHCRSHRDRNDTFIVQSETGEYKQVGRTCLGEFLGISPADALAQANLIDALGEMDDEDFCGKREASGYNLQGFLAHVIKCIRESGWTSRSTAKDALRVSTADQAISDIIDLSRGVRTRGWRSTPINYPTAQDIETAKAVIAWMKALEPCGNEYLFNLLSIAENGFVTGSSAGYAASAYNAMQRDIEQRKAAAGKRHLGNVGEKLTVTARLSQSINRGGYYGVSYLHKFIDGDGNEICWSTAKELEPNRQYTLTGKVKEHGEFRGIPQTFITNAKFEAI